MLTFSALEAAVTRLRYRQKTEEANTSAVLLGLLGGKDGKKSFDSMLKTWRKITQDAAPEKSASKGVSSLMRDFPQGGF